MGLNFIQKTAAHHTKSWRANFQSAAQDMFAADCVLIDRTYLAPVRPGVQLQRGDPVNVRLIKEKVLIYKDIQFAAEIEKPSLDLLENLNSCHGILPGQIEETNDLAGVASVHVGGRRPE